MIAPPRTAELILASLGAERDFRDAVIGDLAEEFAQRAARDGVAPARRWYYQQAFLAAPHLLRNWVRGARRSELARIGGAVVTSATLVLVAGGIVIAGATSIAAGLGVSVGAWPLRWNDPVFAAGAMIGLRLLGGSMWTFAGYVTAWIDSRTPLISAMAFLAVLLFFSIVVNTVTAGSGSVHRLPLWFRLAASTVNVIGMLAGAIIRVRRTGPAIQSL